MKSQDILILLKLISISKSKQEKWSYEEISNAFDISLSTVHKSINSLRDSGFLNAKKINLFAVNEFLVHGLKYVFPVTPGPIVRGFRTVHTPPFNNDKLSSQLDIFVWPHPEGDKKGFSVEPLYKTVPEAFRSDEVFYQLLCIVDALRIGRAREKKEALNLLELILNDKQSA